MKKQLLLTLLLLPALFMSAQKQQWIVAKDGSGKFKTVQEAFDAVPLHIKSLLPSL
jgi:pectin methylesterase-like acyl-CoA thioesterase